MSKAESVSALARGGAGDSDRAGDDARSHDAHELAALTPSAFNSSRYFGFQTTKEKSGPFSFSTEKQARSEQVSTEFLESWEREARSR
jgi:hypothetical protein